MDLDGAPNFSLTDENIKHEVKEEPVEYQEGDYFGGDDDEMHQNLLGSISDQETELPHQSSKSVKSEKTDDGNEDFHAGVTLEEPPVYSRSGRLVKRIRELPPPPSGRKYAKRKRIEPNPLQVPARPSDQRFCLICYNMTNPSSTLNSTSNVAERDFQVMFLLKKMLNVPKERLADYLNNLGFPREWITVCGTCAPTVNKAVVIQKEISRLEDSLRCYQRELIEEVKRSRKFKKETPAVSKKDVLRVTNETRSFVATGSIASTTPTTAALKHKKKELPESIKIERVRKVGKKRKKSTSSLARRLRQMRTLAAKKVEAILGTVPIQIEEGGGGVQVRDVSEKQVEVNLNVPLPPAESTTPSRKRKPIRARPHRQKMKTNKDKLTDNDLDIIALKRSGYRCALCPHIKDLDFHFFTSHMLFHKRRPYKCSECNVYRSSGCDAELDSCPLNKSRKEKSEPHTCSSGTITEAVFKPEKLWTCEYCNEAFDCDVDRNSHENHCSQIDNAKSIVLKNSCTICNRKYRNVVEWRFHMILEHPEEAKFGCYYCNEKFPVKTKEGMEILDYEALRAHLKKCHYFDKFETRMVHDCDFCGKPFWSIPVLSQHIEAEHGIRKKNTMSCEVCFNRAENRSLLFQHLRNIHYLERKKINICDQCGYETFQDYKIEHHKFMEHGVEPKNYQILHCSEEGCDFRTIGTPKMNVHRMKVHNAARQHLCQICGKGFLSSSKLQTHKQIHVNKNVKPFQCEICGNSFAVENYLYIHMRLSHQNRPFASTHKKKATRKKKTRPTSRDEDSLGTSESANNTGNLPPQTVPVDNVALSVPSATSFCNQVTVDYLLNASNCSDPNTLTITQL